MLLFLEIKNILLFFPSLCLCCGGGYTGAAATKLFAAYWGKWITGQTFSSTLFLKQKFPTRRGPRKKHAEISAAVAVVVELNTPFALPLLINKTLKCYRRKGAASLPASHFPWMHYGHCVSALTPHTHTHRFSPFGTLPLALSHPAFTFPHIHSEYIHAYSETFACNLPRVCTALQDTQHMYWRDYAHAFKRMLANACAHKDKTEIENRDYSAALVPRFNVWIIPLNIYWFSSG